MSLSTNAQRIIREIEEYIVRCGGVYGNWYVGIASSPASRLFQDHNVNEQGAWIHIGANSSDEARSIEDYFHNVRHTQGAGGGGDNTTTFVYAYMITQSTRE